MFIEKDNAEDPYKRSNPTNAPGQTSVGSGGGAGPLPGGTTGNPSTVNPATPAQPTQQFANVQDYLGANKAQGEQLGDQFNGKLDQTLNTSKGTIDSAANQVTDQAKQNTVNFDQNLVDSAVKTPTAVANNDNQLKSFLGQWNADYQGPQNFEGTDAFSTATKAASDAATKGTEAVDAGGRKQILQDDFGVYGQGNKGLDQTLLQNSSKFSNTLNKGNDLQNVQSYLQAKGADVNATTANAAQTTADTKTNTRNAFNDSVSNFQKGVQGKVTQAQSDAQAKIAPLQADLKSGDASKLSADLDKMNLPPEQKASIMDYLGSLNKDYGVNSDLSNYYKFNPNTDITAANAASKEDYDNATALNKLTGNDYSTVLNPADAAKAGTWDTTSKGLNSADLDKDLRSRLVQAEVEKLNAPTAPNGGGTSSNPKGENLMSYLKSHPLVDEAINPVLTGGAAVIGGAAKLATNIGKSVSKAFGGGHKDAVVNLPEMKLPDMAVPSKANAATTKIITDIFNKPLGTNGSYHEGAVYDAVSRLGQLKTAFDQGQLTPEEYQGYSQPLAQWANNAANTIMGASSQAANSVKPAAQQLQQYLNTKPNIVRAS